MIENKLQHLFQHYLNAFRDYDLDGVTQCYQLPCTLNTPDNLVFINTAQQCQQEFLAIFSQLKAANTQKISAQKATYQMVSDNICLVCIDWVFTDENEQIFADFAAVYHILQIGDSLKIMNVASHELSNSLMLEHSLVLS